MLVRLASLVLLALPWSLSAVDAEAAHARVDELMAALPAPPVVTPVPSEVPKGDTPMAEGVLVTPEERVVLTGNFLFSEGPTDGLEVLACLAQGKTHEALIGLDTGNAQVVKAAFIAALGLVRDGVPAEELSAVPARGIPVALEIRWQPDALLDPDRWVAAPASALVRSRHTDQAFPALPFVWTGSHFQVIEQEIPGAGLERRERFMLELTRTVFANYDAPDSLFASPFPGAAEDVRFEVNSAIAPREGTRAYLVASRCTLPLSLRLDPAGELRRGEELLDAAALAELLGEIYGPGVEWRAVAVLAPPAGGEQAGVSDAQVVAARERILAAAGAAGVWVVPIFTTE